jgi:hypothetical protein
LLIYGIEYDAKLRRTSTQKNTTIEVNLYHKQGTQRIYLVERQNSSLQNINYHFIRKTSALSLKVRCGAVAPHALNIKQCAFCQKQCALGAIPRALSIIPCALNIKACSIDSKSDLSYNNPNLYHLPKYIFYIIILKLV